MDDEASKQLSDSRFKILVGVQRTTFEEMLAVLKTAYQRKRAKGGRKSKLILKDCKVRVFFFLKKWYNSNQN